MLYNTHTYKLYIVIIFNKFELVNMNVNYLSYNYN